MPRRPKPKPTAGQLTLQQVLAKHPRLGGHDTDDEMDNERPGGTRRSGRTEGLPGQYRDQSSDHDDDDDEDVGGGGDRDRDWAPAMEPRFHANTGKN